MPAMKAATTAVGNRKAWGVPLALGQSDARPCLTGRHWELLVGVAPALALPGLKAAASASKPLVALPLEGGRATGCGAF